MECIVASGMLLTTTYRHSLRQEKMDTSAVISSMCSTSPRSGRTGVALQGLGLAWRRKRVLSSPSLGLTLRREREVSVAAPSVSLRLVARGKNHGRREVVVAAKVGETVDVSVEKIEPLMELSRGQTQFFHQLPSGFRMEVISQKASAPDGGRADSSRAPLVFVHGSYHGAWCWACFWMPYFAARGHDCYAISLLGQGASDLPPGKVSFTLEAHAGDIAHFIKHNLTAPPVLIGHSFGGLIVQWFFTRAEGQDSPFPSIAAVALVCSAPPTGNGPMVMRFLKRDLFSSLQITLSLAAKMFGSSVSICQKSFFSADMPEADVKKYQQVLKRSSRCSLVDIRKVNESLPLPRLPPRAPPVLVLAAENDFIVDQEGAQETAEWYGTHPIVITASAHDLMLDTSWERAAEALQFWLDGQAL